MMPRTATWKVHWHIAMPSGGASTLLPPIRVPMRRGEFCHDPAFAQNPPATRSPDRGLQPRI